MVGVRDSTRRDEVPTPTPSIVRQLVPPDIDDSDRYTMEKFHKNGAELFERGLDLMKVECWLYIMEKTFKAISCSSSPSGKIGNMYASRGSISQMEVTCEVHICKESD